VQLRSKKQAAEFLGISTRAVERAVRRGHLVAQYRPSKHGRMAWFGPEDLSRYRNFQQVRAPLGFSSAVAKAPNEGAFTIGTVTPMALAEREVTPSQSDSSKNVVPLNQRLTLSIAEAVQLSGLPRQFVVNSIQSKKLKSLKLGRSTLVKRSDLEAFVKGL
jgi:excisionase family DNA binding protein